MKKKKKDCDDFDDYGEKGGGVQSKKSFSEIL